MAAIYSLHTYTLVNEHLLAYRANTTMTPFLQKLAAWSYSL